MSHRPDERWCPRCQMRYRLGAPPQQEFAFISVPRGVTRMLLVAAREFDDATERVTPGELFTAVDFCDWLLGSIREEVA